MISPTKFAECMRVIAADPDETEMLRRAIAHCMDALESIGYAAGVAVLAERLIKRRPGAVRASGSTDRDVS